MKYFGVILFVLTGCLSQRTFSQLSDSLFNKYNTQTVYRVGNRFMKGDERINYHDLLLQLTLPQTQAAYQKSENKFFISKLFNAASLAVVMASIFVKSNVGGSVAFAVGAGSCGLAGIAFQKQGNKLIDQAIWIQNRQALFDN